MSLVSSVSGNTGRLISGVTGRKYFNALGFTGSGNTSRSTLIEGKYLPSGGVNSSSSKEEDSSASTGEGGLSSSPQRSSLASSLTCMLTCHPGFARIVHPLAPIRRYVNVLRASTHMSISVNKVFVLRLRLLLGFCDAHDFGCRMAGRLKRRS